MKLCSFFNNRIVFIRKSHCQTFKTKYIALAEEINRRRLDDQPVKFHAVSCSVYNWVCMQNNVKGFPTVVLFKAHSADPHILKEGELTAESIAELLGIHLHAAVGSGDDLESHGEGIDEYSPLDILGASSNGLARTRESVFKDAALSFVHALKTEIFSHKIGGKASGPLESVQREVFSDWIDLLYWSLPPAWILHTLINDIRNNIDYVMESEVNLLSIVAKHQDLVLEPSRQRRCSESDDYSCGMWSLLHIISVGVIERHKAVLGARNQVSTKFVAQTIRNYLQYFFDCKQCKEYFVTMYDACGFNHCRRFKQSEKIPSEDSWTELALWLWEVHNDVNVILDEVGSKARVNSIGPSKRKAESSSWPSQEECPTCRGITGKWKLDVVLTHIRKVYWYVVTDDIFYRVSAMKSTLISLPMHENLCCSRPSGVQNFRFVVLKKKNKSSENERSRFQVLFNLSSRLMCILIPLVMWSTRKRFYYFWLSGQHKKTDDDHTFCNTHY